MPTQLKASGRIGMGLIKAAQEAGRGILADQWLEFFYCDALPVNVMATRGKKRVGKRSSNTQGDGNVISNGSGVAVADGQAMMIVEQGKILDFCVEPGEYTFTGGGEPSLFAGGSLGANVRATLKSTWDRFKYGGQPDRFTRVYYFNTKELIGNKYGTPSPIPFRVVDQNIGLDIDISIRCFGEYSYKITNPLLFYANVCGNIIADYTCDMIDSQLKSELIAALQPAFAKASAMGIRYSALPGHAGELAEAINETLSAKWRDLRGLEVAAFGLSSVKASDEDERMMKELQRNATLRNPSMAAAYLVDAQAAAMKSAAANENVGPAFAFMGMDLAKSVGGMNAQSLFAMEPPQPAVTSTGWSCACGHTGNSKKFCTECGLPKPSADGWACSCGAMNKGKFCPECGHPKPSGVPQYRCDKCGWEPEDRAHPPKFCPECGDPFDNGDLS